MAGDRVRRRGSLAAAADGSPTFLPCVRRARVSTGFRGQRRLRLRQMADSETALQAVLGQDTMIALWGSPVCPKNSGARDSTC